MTARCPSCVLALAALVCLPAVLGLSPPWWERAHKIQAVLSLDSALNVTITEGASNTNNLLVTVKLAPCASCPRKSKAAALATLLAPYGNVKFSGGKVSIRVRLGKETLSPSALPTVGPTAFELAKAGLQGSSAFAQGVVVNNGILPPSYFLLFKPEVVQWYSDDIAQYGGLTTAVAAEAFSRVYGISSMQLTDSSIYCSSMPPPSR